MKEPFIPLAYRPCVPGSKLENLSLEENRLKVSSKQTSFSDVFIIAAKDDIVPYHFLKEITSEKNLTHLYYDELGVTWDFSFFNGLLKLHFKNCVMIPTAIYHRHPGIHKAHPYYHKHIALFEILDIWQGNLIGQKRDHYHNTSKAYQGITSISLSARLSRSAKVKYPSSFFLKGDFRLLQVRCKNSLVVKSCSNIRSKVVSNEVFSQWSLENTKYLPTLFQEKIEGEDIRVHVCGNKMWALKVKNKDCVDYRYASKGTIKYQQVQLPKEIRKFCQIIAQYENNRLIGVDLIKSKNHYFCLESNPGPGWSTFNHPSKTRFAKQILNKLLRKKHEKNISLNFNNLNTVF